MQVEVSIEAAGGDLFPPLVSQSREKWAYGVLLEFKNNCIWRQIGPDKVFYSPEIQNVFQCQLTNLAKT